MPDLTFVPRKEEKTYLPFELSLRLVQRADEISELRGKYGRKGKRGGSSKTQTTSGQKMVKKAKPVNQYVARYEEAAKSMGYVMKKVTFTDYDDEESEESADFKTVGFEKEYDRYTIQFAPTESGIMMGYDSGDGSGVSTYDVWDYSKQKPENTIREIESFLKRAFEDND